MKTPFKWDESADKAFNKLKECLITCPCLLLPDVEKPFILHTDASGVALGAVLSQMDKDEVLHPVAYASRTLKVAEVNYSAFEKELLAVVWGIGNFRHYLYGRSFTLFCDQQSISQALKIKDSGRVSRWALALQNYDITFRHTPGKNNIPADVLSRGVNTIQVNTDSQAPIFSSEFIRSSQEQDVKCQRIINQLNNKNEIILNNITFFMKDKMLYCINKRGTHNNNIVKLVIPKNLISQTLQLAHDSLTSAHPGFKRTLMRVKKNYFWWGQYKHVLNYVKSCVQCMMRRGYNSKNKAPLQRLEITSRPFERIAMDAVGPLPVTYNGSKFIIVMTDYFTRWAEAFPTTNIQADTVALVLEKFIAIHGIPEHLITDRGKSFLADSIQLVYKKLKIKKHNTTSYHPSSDGLVERVNGTIVNTIKHLVDLTGHDWDKVLHLALLAYRTAFHSAIQDTPAHLLYGRDPILPIDLITNPLRRSYADTRDLSEDIQIRLSQAFEVVRQNLTKAAETQEKYRLKVSKKKNIQIGDLVLLYTPHIDQGKGKKLTCFNKGPYRVKHIQNVVNYKIVHVQNPDDEQLVHIDRLTKLPERIIFPALHKENNSSTEDKVEVSETTNLTNGLVNTIPKSRYPIVDVRRNSLSVPTQYNLNKNVRNVSIPQNIDSSDKVNNETQESDHNQEINNRNLPSFPYDLRPRDDRGFVR